MKASVFSGGVNERIFITYEFTDYFYKADAEKAVTQVEQELAKHKDEFYIESLYSFFRANEAGTTLTLTRARISTTSR